MQKHLGDNDIAGFKKILSAELSIPTRQPKKVRVFFFVNLLRFNFLNDITEQAEKFFSLGLVLLGYHLFFPPFGDWDISLYRIHFIYPLIYG